MKRTLSKRQEKVLKLYLAGYKPKDIARIMELNINTVCSYKYIIMEKWEVDNNIELIIKAIRKGYLEIEEEEQNPNVTYTYTVSGKN